MLERDFSVLKSIYNYIMYRYPNTYPCYSIEPPFNDMPRSPMAGALPLGSLEFTTLTPWTVIGVTMVLCNDLNPH